MRILFDKGFIRRVLEGFARIASKQPLTEEQKSALWLLRRNYGEEQLYMSYKSFHTLTHRFGHLEIVQRIFSIVAPLYPTRYTRRWARRLRKLEFGREDALLISMGSFSADKLYHGRLLGVDRIVTLDKRMYERFHNHQARLVSLSNLRLPEIETL